MELASGDPAPAINADASNGRTVTFADYPDKYIVLFFYPKNDTPGCTREACTFRDFIAKLTGLGATILGCSPDDLRSHDRFISKYDLPFVLLSDPDHRTALDYGVWKEKNMYGRKIIGVERSTFLISPDQKIVRIWRRVKVEGHIDEIIDELKMLV